MNYRFEMKSFDIKTHVNIYMLLLSGSMLSIIGFLYFLYKTQILGTNSLFYSVAIDKSIYFFWYIVSIFIILLLYVYKIRLYLMHLIDTMQQQIISCAVVSNNSQIVQSCDDIAYLCMIFKKQYVCLYSRYVHVLQKLYNDTLTGLRTRAYYYYIQAQGYISDTLGILLCDIDFFKHINDTYGHEIGDMVLCEFARWIRFFFPINSHVIRWGGEEFLILTPYVSHVVLQKLAYDFQQYAQKYQYKSIRESLSISCVCGQSMAHMIDAYRIQLDTVLYYAKQQGRNQVWYVDSENNHAWRIEGAYNE